MNVEGMRKVIVAVVGIVAVAAMAILGVNPSTQDWAKEIILWIVGLFTAGNAVERVINRPKTNGTETPPVTP